MIENESNLEVPIYVDTRVNITLDKAKRLIERFRPFKEGQNETFQLNNGQRIYIWYFDDSEERNWNIELEEYNPDEEIVYEEIGTIGLE